MAPGQLPESVDLTPHAPPPFDQGSTSSCTGNANSAAIYTTLSAAGTPLPWVPSQKDLYTIARSLERHALGLDEHTPLDDFGADPADVISAMTVWGVRPIRCRTEDEIARRCDCSPDTVNEEETLMDLEEDAERLLISAREIVTTLDIRASLARGEAVPFAWCVIDEDFNAGPGTVLTGRVGTSNHDSVFLGYRKTDDGYLFRVQNSWGDWGDQGRIWVTESFARSTDCRYAISVKRI